MERGLKLHDELATKDLRPFHNKMETCFADMKARVTGEERKSTRPKDLQVGIKTTRILIQTAVSSVCHRSVRHDCACDFS